jgi:hypothetical protein
LELNWRRNGELLAQLERSAGEIAGGIPQPTQGIASSVPSLTSRLSISTISPWNWEKRIESA